MAGIGDSWGTAQELLHPRDSHGRFRTKWKMSPSVLAAVEKVLQAFRPRTFQSDGQAAQYNFNLASRKPGRFGGGKGFARLQADYHAANEDLRDGNIDDPSTKKFVDMMDQAAIELPDDAIISRVVGPDAFGLTAEQLPQLEEMTGNVIADRGYGAANIGTPLGGGQGLVTMVMATPKGTKMIVPGRNPNDRAMFYDRDQEFTITKVKPDGRGGYTVYAVATPKTPGQTPITEGVGHQGPGISPDREAAVKALENAGAQREMGAQPPGQAPPGASGPIPQAGAGTPEEQRAARRAQVLGRPAGPNATPQAQQEAAAPQAPAPTAPAVPSAPAPTPAPAPNVPAAPAAPATPNAPAPPSGATSVVTGEPATSFREVAKGLESPSAGPRRREWNSAYQGVVSGKQHPQDMLRELEADISNNKEIQKTEPGLGDSVLAHDIEKQEKLADLIRSHFNLGEPVQRQPRQEVRNELEAKASKAAKAALLRPGGGTEKAPPGKKTAAEAATPGPLAKVAPKRTGTPQERAKALGTQREQDLKDNQLNAEQRSRWADEVGKEPASLTPDNASSVLLDETADLLRNGRTTRAKAVDRLREQARDQNTPEADYLRKVADAIEADTSKPAKRVPLKKAAPKAAPNVAAAEASLEGRSDKNILTGLNKLSVGDMRAVAEKWGINTRGEDKKLKLKAVLAKELAAHWKATPELQRKKEGGVPGAPSVTATPASAEEQLANAKAAVAQLGRPGGMKAAAPAKVNPAESAGEKALAEAKASVAKIGRPKTPAAKALTQIAESPDLPPELKKAAKKAAAVEGAAPGTAAGKITASRLKSGSRVLVTRNEDGSWSIAKKKTGAVPLTVTSTKAVPGAARGRLQIRGTDPDGNEVSLDNVAAHQTLFGASEASGGKFTGDAAAVARIVESTRASDKARQAKLGLIPTPAPETKIPGIDTAERARLQARAKEVLAEMQNKSAADPWEQMAKDLGDTEVSRDLVARAKKIKEEVEATSGPSGISVEDRVAARLLSSVKPEYRQGILDEMSPADRKHMLDIAERVAAEDTRVKKSGHSLDRILSDAGIKVPKDADSQPAYEEVKQLLADNKVQAAQRALKDEMGRVDFGLQSLRKTAGDPNASEKQRQYAGAEITKLLSRSEWLRSVAGALHGGSTTSPELVTRKEAQQVIPIRLSAAESKIFTPDALRAFADQQGIKLPEGELSRDQLLTELARESIRRELAGKPLKAPDAIPPKLPEKVKAPVEHAHIDARALAPEAGFDSGDKKLLDRVQALLDGDPDAMREAGFGKTKPTPAAVGRYVDGAVRSSGTQRAMGALTLDAARQGLKDHPERADYWNQIITEREATQKSLQDQMDRWQTLADKLKKTRRTPVKKAAAPTPEAPAVKTTLARAAKSAPAKAVRKLTARDLENRNAEQIQQAFEEGRLSPTLAVRGLRRQAQEMRNRVAHGQMGSTMGKGVVGTGPSEMPPETKKNLQHRADLAEKYDRWADNIEGKTPAKKLTKKAAAVAAEEQSAKGIATLARGGNNPNPITLPGASVGEDYRLVREARDRKKLADENFHRAEDKVANLDPELDNPDAAQWEDDLDTARDERDAADEDLANLLKQLRAKSAAPAPAVETQVAKKVAKKAARKEVQAEVAKKTAPAAPAKAARKAAPTAVNPPGSKKYTDAELQDMSLGDLVDIENERGIKRVSVAKADRIQAILNQQENTAAVAEPAPVKKVTAKASKAAAAKIEAAPPSKAAPTKIPTSKIQAGKYSNKPVIRNTWGGSASPVAYHQDGAIGQAVERMGADAALDVNGDRLDNVLGRIATDTVMGRTSQQEMIDKLRKLSSELPAGSVARQRLESAVEEMDTPQRSINIPTGLPGPLTELARELEGIPLARNDKRGNVGSSELSRLEKILQEFKSGQLGGYQLIDAIERLHNVRHESQEGKFELDRAIVKAKKLLDALHRDPKTRSTLRMSAEG